MQRVGTSSLRSEPRQLYCSINFCDAVYKFFLALMHCNSRIVTDILVRDKNGSIIFMGVDQYFVISQGNLSSYDLFKILLAEVKNNGADAHIFGSTEEAQRFVRDHLNPKHEDLLFDHVHLSNKDHRKK